jgi:response regulator RpfG family c-di-GMP phosphodiesterase
MADAEKQETFNVLFVDDEENVLRSLKRLFLDVDNVEVFTALSGKEGLEILKNNKISAIISDQRMPEMSGAEFLERARKISPDSVRVVLTGYADINAAIDAINKGGAYRYITKPWNDSDIVITILNAVERYRLIKENKRLTELTKKQNEELKKWSSELEFYVQQHTVELTKQNKELKRLNDKLKKNLNDFISSFVNLIELRDRTVLSHSSNVAAISAEVAKRLGLRESEIETITTAAKLHDIGKIGVPDIVLLKNTEDLNEEELNEYRKHPVRGQTAVDSIEDLQEEGILIRHHHEWYNGKGFPDRLTGEQIPIGSRIISLADRFDRLMHSADSTRNVQSALTIMQPMLSIQFDPKIFGFLVETVKDKVTAIDYGADLVEKELLPKDLMPGMIVSRDVRSGTGLLLLRRAAALNDKNIGMLRRTYHLDPAKTGIFVWVKTGVPRKS